MLAGETALVTGGGRGIGAAIGRALAAAGARVVLAARSVADVEAVAAEIRGSGGEAIALAADVSDPEAVASLVSAAERAVGPLDLLVNNAGVASSAPLARQSLEAWRELFQVNVDGVFLVSRALVPGMVARRRGRVVNVASIAGRTGAAYISAYAASKHAVVGFTRALAAEIAPSGVTVNAVCPGYVDTPMTDRSIERIVDSTRLDEATARRKLVESNPQGRLITADEVAALVLFLCGESARGIHGQAIGIDGGAFLG